MSEQLSLEDWNWVTSMATQAMIGSISANIREVVLSYREGKWRIVAVLERESEEDRLSIEEVREGLSIFLEDIREKISVKAHTDVEADVNTFSGDLTAKDDKSTRILFRRRE